MAHTCSEVCSLMDETLDTDLASAEEIITYVGPTPNSLRRWILRDAEGVWWLVTDYKEPELSWATLMSGQAGRSVFMRSSSPRILLASDSEFSPLRHTQEWTAIEAAMERYGIIDCAPFISVGDVDSASGGAYRTMMSMLGWQTAEILLEPLGEKGSMSTVYAGEGPWVL